MSCLIPLSQGKFTTVDDADHEWLSRWKWCYHPRGYAVRTIVGGKVIFMHREIVNPSSGKQVDHINHDKLDNRRSNLRECTPQQNMMNRNKKQSGSSQYKGVYWEKAAKSWHAYIRVDRKLQSLGRFKSEPDAARAYDRAARLHFGEFARLNFPEEPQP